MKLEVATIALLAGVSAAQNMDVSGLPQCGQVCITNMMGQHAELDCAANDFACLCSKQDFSYGIRDCSNEVCTENAEDATTTQEFGRNFCARYGVVVSETTGGSNTAQGTSTTTAKSTGTVTVPVKPPMTSTFTSTTTSGTIEVLSTGVTTISGARVPSTTVRVTPTTTGSEDEEAASTTTTTSTDLAPRQTAGLVGIAAAAGMAALLF